MELFENKTKAREKPLELESTKSVTRSLSIQKKMKKIKNKNKTHGSQNIRGDRQLKKNNIFNKIGKI